MTPGIGGKTVTRILARNDLLGRTPEGFLGLDAAVYREEYRMAAKPAAALKAHDVRETVELERKLDGLGVTLVTAADAHYPARIEEFDTDPPGVLFLYGNLRLLEARTFCVLSSRNTSLAGLDKMERLAEEGVLGAEVLVTGHDRPEYQRTAIVPLRWGAPRVLVLDRGLFNVLGPTLRDEAFRAARLWRYEFDPTTDLVVSAFRPEADFVGINNRVRDRLIASLSARLDFIEISEGGNMEKLIRASLKAKRPTRIWDCCIGYRAYRDLGAAVIE
ncbi:MAG: DNA-processing protein DprA [Fimbriimonas sp.]